ncbi:zinc finger protein 382 isoform X10 [Myotis daubentonii]|uniref:zinc finger protein 382 isoform X10 n=1 Tax=Myotis daubentonii TaxID=98922 RepID=UPI0028735001|nr:zinc finger protein 382 isoform X10 [Myotis daubentonii]
MILRLCLELCNECAARGCDIWGLWDAGLLRTLPFPKEELKREGSSLANLTAMPQGSVSFKDVTVDFTQEEWQQLDTDQKALYRDVMLENYYHLISVGFHMTKPDMIRKLEEGKELWTTERIFSSQSYLGSNALG